MIGAVRRLDLRDVASFGKIQSFDRVDQTLLQLSQLFVRRDRRDRVAGHRSRLRYARLPRNRLEQNGQRRVGDLLPVLKHESLAFKNEKYSWSRVFAHQLLGGPRLETDRRLQRGVFVRVRVRSHQQEQQSQAAP